MVEKTCSVKDCGKTATRELSYPDAKVLEKKAGLELKIYHARPPRRPGVVYLCEEHYKLWKRLSREERKIRDMVLKS